MVRLNSPENLGEIEFHENYKAKSRATYSTWGRSYVSKRSFPFSETNYPRDDENWAEWLEYEVSSCPS